jgi:hypothetical protein
MSATERERTAYPSVKGRVDSGSRVACLCIQPDVARPATHIIDRNGILRETLIAGQSYESFDRIKPHLCRRLVEQVECFHTVLWTAGGQKPNSPKKKNMATAIFI